jgi:hypothetical protein
MAVELALEAVKRNYILLAALRPHLTHKLVRLPHREAAAPRAQQVVSRPLPVQVGSASWGTQAGACAGSAPAFGVQRGRVRHVPAAIDAPGHGVICAGIVHQPVPARPAREHAHHALATRASHGARSAACLHLLIEKTPMHTFFAVARLGQVARAPGLPMQTFQGECRRHWAPERGSVRNRSGARKQS